MDSKQIQEKRYVDVQQLSEMLGVKTSWIRHMVFQEKIPFIKLEGLIRFDTEMIKKWIKELSRGSEC